MSDDDKRLYRGDARRIVDDLFDKNLFNPDLTRADLRELDDYFEYLIESRVGSYIRGKELVAKLKRDRVI